MSVLCIVAAVQLSATAAKPAAAPARPKRCWFRQPYKSAVKQLNDTKPRFPKPVHLQQRYQQASVHGVCQADRRAAQLRGGQAAARRHVELAQPPGRPLQACDWDCTRPQWGRNGDGMRVHGVCDAKLHEDEAGTMSQQGQSLTTAMVACCGWNAAAWA